MGAKSLSQARGQAESFARRAMTGNRNHKKRYQGRAAKIGEEIFRQFQIGPTKWRKKHLLWFFREYLPNQKQAAPATQYEYWLACKAVLEGLDRYGQFELPPGPWMTPTGEIPKDSGKGRRQMLKRNVGELTDSRKNLMDFDK